MNPKAPPFGRVLGDLVLVKFFLALLLDELEEQPARSNSASSAACGENFLFEDAKGHEDALFAAASYPIMRASLVIESSLPAVA